MLSSRRHFFQPANITNKRNLLRSWQWQSRSAVRSNRFRRSRSIICVLNLCLQLTENQKTSNEASLQWNRKVSVGHAMKKSPFFNIQSNFIDINRFIAFLLPLTTFFSGQSMMTILIEASFKKSVDVRTCMHAWPKSFYREISRLRGIVCSWLARCRVGF